MDRRSVRLRFHDYRGGLYVVTVCTDRAADAIRRYIAQNPARWTPRSPDRHDGHDGHRT